MTFSGYAADFAEFLEHITFSQTEKTHLYFMATKNAAFI